MLAMPRQCSSTTCRRSVLMTVIARTTWTPKRQHCGRRSSGQSCSRAPEGCLRCRVTQIFLGVLRRDCHCRLPHGVFSCISEVPRSGSPSAARSWWHPSARSVGHRRAGAHTSLPSRPDRGCDRCQLHPQENVNWREIILLAASFTAAALPIAGSGCGRDRVADLLAPCKGWVCFECCGPVSSLRLLAPSAGWRQVLAAAPSEAPGLAPLGTQ
mmetsp:Transcript_32047/g.81333  ORF Transcript_32047/g.81333 Transcript_32047/m.81333 type:complete len:213 (-) Transcript_32047:78-716(-)